MARSRYDEGGGYATREPARESTREWAPAAPQARVLGPANARPYEHATPEGRTLTRSLRAAVSDANTAVAELAAMPQREPAQAERLETAYAAAVERAEQTLAGLDAEKVPAGCLDAMLIRDAKARLAELSREAASRSARTTTLSGTRADAGRAAEDARLATVASFALVDGRDAADVRRAWITGSGHPQADRIRTDRMLEVLVALRSADRFVWATDADLDAAAAAHTRLPSDQHGPIVTLELGVAMCHHAGLPAGEPARIARRADGIDVVLALPGSRPDGEWTAIDADGVDALGGVLGDAMGAIDRAALGRLVHADRRALVRHGTVQLVFSAAQCAELVGAEAWHAWSPQDTHADRLALARTWLSTTLGVTIEDVPLDLAALVGEIDRHPFRAAIVRHAKPIVQRAGLTAALLETLAHDAVEAALRGRAPVAPEWDELARTMASALGVGTVPVQVDRAVTDREDARGVALGGVVHLHPERVTPDTPEGREVLAHELIHVAQARLPIEQDVGRDAAEAEAMALAPLVASGQAVRPSRFIDASRPAADGHGRRHHHGSPDAGPATLPIELRDQTIKKAEPDAIALVTHDRSTALVTASESVTQVDHGGDVLHVEATYQLETRPGETGGPNIWIVTERRAVLTLTTGEVASLQVRGEAIALIGIDEARDPVAEILARSEGANHSATVYLPATDQYISEFGHYGTRQSLAADVADVDLLAYDDPQRMLIALRQILRHEGVAGHGSAIHTLHRRVPGLLAKVVEAERGLDEHIAEKRAYRDGKPGEIANADRLLGDLTDLIADIDDLRPNGCEDVNKLLAARRTLLARIAEAKAAHAPHKGFTEHMADVVFVPFKFAKRTVDGVIEGGKMLVDFEALQIAAIGKATHLWDLDWHPISAYGKWADQTNAKPLDGVAAMIEGFVGQWKTALERARNGDYSALWDVEVDTFFLIDGARSSAASLLGEVRSVGGAAAALAKKAGVPAEASEIASAMSEACDALLAKQPSPGGGTGGAPSAESLSAGLEAASETFAARRVEATKSRALAALDRRLGSDEALDTAEWVTRVEAALGDHKAVATRLFRDLVRRIDDPAPFMHDVEALLGSSRLTADDLAYVLANVLDAAHGDPVALLADVNGVLARDGLSASARSLLVRRVVTTGVAADGWAGLTELLDRVAFASGADRAAAESKLLEHIATQAWNETEVERIAAVLEPERARVLEDAALKARRSVAGSSEQMIDQLARDKALPEQHAHEQGSVPLDTVLSNLNEGARLTEAGRAKQIEVLEAMIREATNNGERDLVIGALDARTTRANVIDGTVSSPGAYVIATKSGAKEVGILNQLLELKQQAQVLVARGGEGLDVLAEQITDLLGKYRTAVVMNKPPGARYEDLVVTGQEFFVRYSMLIEHGQSTAQIARGRASAGQLGMQELRYSPDRPTLDSIRADADRFLSEGTGDADASLTYATTKKRTSAESVGKNEQPLTRDFVDAWYQDGQLRAAFNGLDNAGVEHAEMTPAAMWESASTRAFRNAAEVQAKLDTVLVSASDANELAARVARASGTTPDAAMAMISRFRAVDVDASIAAIDGAAVKTRAADAALRGQRADLRRELASRGLPAVEVEAQVDGAHPWRPAVPGLDAGTGRLELCFAGTRVDDVARDARAIIGGLDRWAAETGRPIGELDQLGFTVHAGEQLHNPNVDPFVLLDQVDQAVAMGTDRIGHGLILAVDPEVLVEHDLLPAARVDELARRQAASIAEIRARGVVVEANLSSNSEISNLTLGEHPAGRLVEEGVRVTVNTDDETVLGVTIQSELERFARTPGVQRADVAATVLEGYQSRLGHRALGQRDRVAASLREALTAGLSPAESDQFVRTLAAHFGVAEQATPERTLDVLLATILGGTP